MENSLEPGIYHLDNSEGSNPSRKTEKQGRTTVAYIPINIPQIKPTYCGILLAGSWQKSPTFLHITLYTHPLAQSSHSVLLLPQS